MIMITIRKDLYLDYSISYVKEVKNTDNCLEVYQFIKFNLEDWEVGQYLGGN